MNCLIIDDHRCALCDAVTQQPFVFDHPAPGAMDLDGRPPPPERGRLCFLIQRCDNCGYCHPDIGVDVPVARALRDDPGYRAELWNDTRPVRANHFLCWSRIAAAAGRMDQAARAAVRAAWICDDGDAPAAAAACRSRAAGLVLQARALRQPVADDALAEALLLSDLYRRAGAMALARAEVERARNAQPSSPSPSALDYVLHLVETGDRAAHTLVDARIWVRGRQASGSGSRGSRQRRCSRRASSGR